jgi:uncharacterized repeat protein (TIGR03803 family)
MPTLTQRAHAFRIRLPGPALAALALLPLIAGSATAGDPRILFHFDEDEGSYPDTDVALDAAGNLYGMTVQGGDFNGGTVFRLSPVAGGWEHTVLHHFTGGPDGGQPYGGVTLDAQGNVYGTTVIGGSGGPCVEDGCGTVFRLTPGPGDTWTHTVIHDFTGGTDGFGAGAPVVLDRRGNVYGMTPSGGESGFGVVYQLSPQAGGGYHETILHAFTGGEDGAQGSKGRMLVDAQGTLWGLSTVGGANGVGSFFRIDPLGGGAWGFTPLYSFQGQPGGVFPYGGLVRDAAGSFYGTTYYGGTAGVGAVYRLSLRNGEWTETVLHSFGGSPDGASPISTLAWGQDGALYGTTSEGGTTGHGTLFRTAPDAAGSWVTSVIYSFGSLPDGALPYAGLTPAPDGSFYGATVYGGLDDDGTVFRVKP